MAWSGFIIFACYLGYDVIGSNYWPYLLRDPGQWNLRTVHTFISLTAKITPSLTATLIGNWRDKIIGCGGALLFFLVFTILFQTATAHWDIYSLSCLPDILLYAIALLSDQQMFKLFSQSVPRLWPYIFHYHLWMLCCTVSFRYQVCRLSRSYNTYNLWWLDSEATHVYSVKYLPVRI